MPALDHPAARPGNVTQGLAGCGSARRHLGEPGCPERPHSVPTPRWV